MPFQVDRISAVFGISFLAKKARRQNFTIPQLVTLY
jgi:hypothetical protein